MHIHTAAIKFTLVQIINYVTSNVNTLHNYIVKMHLPYYEYNTQAKKEVKSLVLSLNDGMLSDGVKKMHIIVQTSAKSFHHLLAAVSTQRWDVSSSLNV